MAEHSSTALQAFMRVSSVSKTFPYLLPNINAMKTTLSSTLPSTAQADAVAAVRSLFAGQPWGESVALFLDSKLTLATGTAHRATRNTQERTADVVHGFAGVTYFAAVPPKPMPSAKPDLAGLIATLPHADATQAAADYQRMLLGRAIISATTAQSNARRAAEYDKLVSASIRAVVGVLPLDRNAVHTVSNRLQWSLEKHGLARLPSDRRIRAELRLMQEERKAVAPELASSHSPHSAN